MNEISLVVNGTLNNSKYLPMIKLFEEHLCCAYGLGFPKNYKITDEPIEKMYFQKVSSRISGFLINPLSKILKCPQYYTFLSNLFIADILYYKKVANDASKLVIISPLLCRTVEMAKKHGKFVVIEAGNSEPEREHRRIVEEYEKFNINHKYIYGDPVFKNICLNSMELADRLIVKTEVSKKTYLNAGFSDSKLHLIPQTGTDFPIQKIEFNSNKRKAFVSTAFHNFIKGTHRLLNAWKKANIKDIPLIIIGRLCEDMQDL